MSLGRHDLVLCSGTLPRSTPFRLRVEAAAAGGFRGLSLWGRDYAAARQEGWSDADLAGLLADHGVEVAELDPAWWWTPGAGAVTVPPELDPVDVFRFGEEDLFHVAAAVGARSLNAADVLGGRWGVEEAAEAFARLCDRAAEHGLLVHLEWLAWSRIPDMPTAVEVVRRADRPNGGLTVDLWHCARTGVTPGDLAALAPGTVLAVQVDDGPGRAEPDLVEATLHRRLVPGEGDFDVVGYLGALDAAHVDAPIGVEVFSDELHALGPLEAARRAGEATRAVLARVRPGPPSP
ncbi:MAG TPA: sugar phosphate isomerase/epimerase [Acidimicrobiales bacterium]|nr:sugar phosphate isomerase/epimerase [Acidimicrobiales bacterium]